MEIVLGASVVFILLQSQAMHFSWRTLLAPNLLVGNRVFNRFIVNFSIVMRIMCPSLYILSAPFNSWYVHRVLPEETAILLSMLEDTFRNRKIGITIIIVHPLFNLSHTF